MPRRQRSAAVAQSASPSRIAIVLWLALGIVAGVLLERYVGTATFIDLSGLRHLRVTHELRFAGDRARVPPASLPANRTLTALVFGQSNAANAGETPGAPQAKVYEYFRGELLEARDPLLGAEGGGGSIWLRLGTLALQGGEHDAVVLVPFAFSSSEIARWAPGGNLHEALIERIAAAQRAGLRFTHLLWQHGEADARAGTSAAAYREGFLAMLAAIRLAGIDAPVYVARSTRCARTRDSDTIRSAQANLPDAAAGIFAGPDTDALGFAERFDGCHFSKEGLDKAARLWLEAIRRTPR